MRRLLLVITLFFIWPVCALPALAAPTFVPTVERTLFVNIQRINQTTGEVVFNGVDTKPVVNTGFVWIWGDGTTTNGFFPQTKVYADVSRNYVAKVVANYTDGLTDTVSIAVEFVGPLISTVAGPNNIGDGGQGALATLNSPNAVITDPAGNIYIAEAGTHRIRKISTSGIITTIAGTGVPGFSGDGGPATAAQLNGPVAMAVDGAGNLFIADYENNRIRKISATGTITTVAGTGNYGFSGDGGPATAALLNGAFGVAADGSGNVYIADVNNNRIRKVGTNGIIATIAGTNTFGFSGDGGLATAAQLNAPTAVAVSANGTVYVSDFQNSRIRRISTNGVISTIAGTGIQGTSGDGGAATAAQISFYLGLATDAAGNVYIADLFNNRVRKIASNGIITRVAGATAGGGFAGDGGLATDAFLSNPAGIVVDAGGNLLIADQGNNRIRQVNTSGLISTISGPNNAGFGGDGGPATAARLGFPVDVKVDKNGNFFIAELGNSRIRKVDATGIITTVAGITGGGFSGDGGPATSARLAGPYGVLPDGAGNIYIADTFNNRIRKVSSSGSITTIAGTAVGGFSGDAGPATSAQLKLPYNLALDKAGNLYIADSDNNRIRRINASGIIVTVVGSGAAGFGGDGGPATAAQLNYPTGISFDAADNLYIADNRNHRIRRVTPAGVISTIAGTGTIGNSGSGGAATAAELAYPFGIVVSANGTVFLSENGNLHIRRIGTNGIITDIAGSNSRGFLGDGGLANQAQLDNIFGLCLDGAGNLLIADAGNARIRKVACINPPVVSIAAASTLVCVSDVVSLTAVVANNAGPITYSWSGNTTPTSVSTVSASVGTGLSTFTVTVTTQTGCAAKATISLQSVPLYSVKSGNWNDPTTWSCGREPTVTDPITINHAVTVPASFMASALRLTYGASGKLIYGFAGRLRLGP